jgi:hypothetical protein
MAAPNIVNVTSIIGKTIGINPVQASATTVVENTAASNKVLKVNTLVVSNIDTVNDADISVAFRRSSTDYYFARTVTVPADSSLVIISKDNQIYLEEGDLISAQASADGDLQVVCSYEEIS